MRCLTSSSFDPLSIKEKNSVADLRDERLSSSDLYYLSLTIDQMLNVDAKTVWIISSEKTYCDLATPKKTTIALSIMIVLELLADTFFEFFSELYLVH